MEEGSERQFGRPVQPYRGTGAMSLELTLDDSGARLPNSDSTAKSFPAAARSSAFVLIGVAALLAFWWIGGWLIASSPATANFAGFAPVPTFARLWRMLLTGEAIHM